MVVAYISQVCVTLRCVVIFSDLNKICSFCQANGEREVIYQGYLVGVGSF